ncbi:hypothetical protein MMC16_001818 [Acarospora aff. strigata]|nr:hypothetical protein [Acarospora aff. strigata]
MPPTANISTFAAQLSSIQDDSDADSQGAGSDDDEISSTQSLTDSICNYPIENGRSYHKYREGSYCFPNDPAELERLDLQYEMLKILHRGRIYFAPLHKPKRILDIGTGTGIWPIDMAELFPSASIIGTDLSPTQPNMIPSNVHFLIDDASEPDWLYPPSHFSYIHTRILLGCFEDFRQIINRSFKYLEPGGYMESQELYSTLYCDDGTMPPDWKLLEWIRHLDDAAMTFGRPLRIANKLKRWYQEAGFVDVEERVFKLPINPWPEDQRQKELGRWSEMNMLDGIQGFSLAWFSRVLGWTKAEIEVFLVGVRKAISQREVHAYNKSYVVWGRKPYPHELAAKATANAKPKAKPKVP